MRYSDIQTAFSYSEIFRGIEPKNIIGGFGAEFERGAEINEFQNGIECAGVVVSGAISVHGGDQTSFSVLKRGGEFGICNIFVHEKMPARLTARTNVSVFFTPKEEFARLLGEDGAMMYRYVKLCNEKMMFLAEKVRILSIADCTERLYSYLKSQADEKGRISLISGRDDLAKKLGFSRSSLYRALSALKEDGRVSEDFQGEYIISMDR